MNSSNIFKIIETHTAGNPTRHIMSGIPKVLGNTMAEKMKYFTENLDWVRRVSMLEPRGHSCMAGTVYTEPCNPEADMGVLFFDASGYLAMCGHSTIAVATVLVETGMVPMAEPITEVKLDTPAGLVAAKVHVSNNRVDKVTFRNIPSFLYDVKEIEIGNYGRVRVEVAYGGNPYAIVKASDFKLDIEPTNAKEIVEKAYMVHEAASREIGFHHPEKTFMNRITSVMFYGDPTVAGADNKEVVVVIPEVAGNAACVDRSPCGTGTSARVASLFVQGKLKLGKEFVNESIIGTCFAGRIVEETKVGNLRAGIPEITGTAYFTASTDMLVDPRDSLNNGFLVS
jgi:proline racemase